MPEKKGTPKPGTAPHGARYKKGFDGNVCSSSNENSDRLLHFARANLPQGGGAAQPHVAAGITALQLFQRANHAFHGLVLFRTAWLCHRRGAGCIGCRASRVTL